MSPEFKPDLLIHTSNYLYSRLLSINQGVVEPQGKVAARAGVEGHFPPQALALLRQAAWLEQSWGWLESLSPLV